MSTIMICGQSEGNILPILGGCGLCGKEVGREEWGSLEVVVRHGNRDDNPARECVRQLKRV